MFFRRGNRYTADPVSTDAGAEASPGLLRSADSLDMPPLEALLRGLRKKKDEVQLTRCLSDLAGADAKVAAGITSALLGSAAKDKTAGRRAAKLYDAMPEFLVWRHQVTEHRSRAQRQRRRGGILDWTISGSAENGLSPDFLLGVEVKIDAAIANPWEAYYKHLASEQAASWGLVLLTRTRPSGRQVPDAGSHRNWAGVALWHEVVAKLHEVEPDGEMLRRVWPILLTVLSDERDLGAAPIMLDDLRQTRPAGKLAILLQTAENAVQVEAKEALRRRPMTTHASRVRIWAKTNRRGRNPRLELITSPDDKKPAISIELTVTDQGLQLITRVRPLQPRRLARAAKKSQQTAIRRLARQGFEAESGGTSHVRTRALATTADDLRELVSDEAAHEAASIIGTGVLDYDD